MSVINSQPLIGASGNQGAAYNIERSLRFRSSASANLSRTPASAGNRKIWTWSGWMKRGYIGSSFNAFFGAGTGSFTEFMCYWNGDTISLGASNIGNTDTTAVFRDPASWYHVVIAFDTTQATANNRAKVYVNGILQTWSSTLFVAQNTDYAINNNVIHRIGQRGDGSLSLDAYMTEVNFIDGQALTPSSFGETDTITGVWKPKAYTGTYGTNGFYLKFNTLTSTSTLGNDSSGNSNTWTVNNVSLTTGATYDSMTDVPTLTSATAANYCVVNPLSSTATPSGGNLQGTIPANKTMFGSMAFPSTGKWYFEAVMTNSANLNVGLAIYVTNAAAVYNISSSVLYSASGVKNVDNVLDQAYGASFASGDVIGIAADADAGSVTFYKNNTSQGAISHVVAGLFPAFGNGGNSTDFNTNFGQRPFAYTPPSGFVALNTFNLPTSTIVAGNKVMDAVTYTGTGSSRSVTGYNFSPDLVWIKERSGVADHALYDSVRGVQIQLESNTTTAETTETTGLTALNSDGFTVGALAQVNTNTDTYVAWAWDANGAGSSNTAGTITSTVSANASAGFSVVTYTGNGTSGATIGHGIGVAPKMIFVKQRNSAVDWRTYTVGAGNTGGLILNKDIAFVTDSSYWNNTTPGSSVFTVGDNAYVNGSGGTYVAYCWSQIDGYSAFGSYTGNGSADGPFIYTGFRPKWIIVKRSDSSGTSWLIIDTSLNPSNNAANYLIADNATAQNTDNGFDILSNGFKVRNSGSTENASGGTYIYAAFAENPFKNSLAR